MNAIEIGHANSLLDKRSREIDHEPFPNKNWSCYSRSLNLEPFLLFIKMNIMEISFFFKKNKMKRELSA